VPVVVEHKYRLAHLGCKYTTCCSAQIHVARMAPLPSRAGSCHSTFKLLLMTAVRDHYMSKPLDASCPEAQGRAPLLLPVRNRLQACKQRRHGKGRKIVRLPVCYDASRCTP